AGQWIADVQADLARRLPVGGERRRAARRRYGGARQPRERIWRDVERRVAMDVAKHDVLRLRWIAELELRVDLGERHSLLEPGDETCRGEPHDGFPVCVRVEADAREWNSDLGEPAVLRDGGTRAPERVPTAVERGAIVGDELVE